MCVPPGDQDVLTEPGATCRRKWRRKGTWPWQGRHGRQWDLATSRQDNTFAILRLKVRIPIFVALRFRGKSFFPPFYE